MSNPISQYGNITQTESFARTVAEKNAKKLGVPTSNVSGTVGTATGSAMQPATTASQADDVLNLSDISERVKAEPEIDRAKVDAIKLALQNGQYPLNSRRTAECFVALERLIRD